MHSLFQNIIIRGPRRTLCRFYSTKSLNKFTYRTHNCGELRSEHIGQSVTICGWLQYIRTHKFLLLRDAYGLTQAILPGKVLMQTSKNLYLESVLKISGTVTMRPEKDRNPKIPTGEVEVVAEDVEVLNECRPNLPFEVKKYNVVEDEGLRMRHRYLFLRQERMQHMLRLRSDVVGRMRRYLREEAGFVDVETPTLFRGTPGGAEEFLVPSRHPGEFYSLPQSPQQFKQILMIGGVDRYFQVARCYRDETTKPDRQPEFTQLDLELSFTTQSEVMHLVECLLEYSWPQGFQILDTPFPVMTYKDVMSTYGTDKPDIRYHMKINDFTSLFDGLLDGIFGKEKRVAFADWSIQGIVAEKVGNTLNQKAQENWKKFLEHHKFAERFGVLKIKPDSIMAGSLTKYVPGGVQKMLIEKLNLKPDDALILSWGERKNVKKTLGFLRKKAAETLEEKNVAVLRNPEEFRFLWVTEFPLFSKKEKGEWESEHHPFTAPLPEHESMLMESPDNVLGQHYDLVLNGVELGGGSIRIQDSSLQRHVLEHILKEDPADMKHLLDALEMGAPPHGGIALGLDRYIAALLNAGSLREVIAFPKTTEGRDIMSGAPRKVSEAQLMKYKLKVIDS